MQTTENLVLQKPSYEDDADIMVINANMDIIDDAIGQLKNETIDAGDMTRAVYDPTGKATDIFTYADQAAWILDSATKTYYRWGVENGKLYVEEITKGGGA